MRAKRNEILTSHETSIVRKDYSSLRKEKTITPSQKVLEKVTNKSEKVPSALEFDAKLDRFQAEMLSTLEQQKRSVESRVVEILAEETEQLRKEFRQDRLQQVGSKMLQKLALRVRQGLLVFFYIYFAQIHTVTMRIKLQRCW
jgi:hypothetical protein